MHLRTLAIVASSLLVSACQCSPAMTGDAGAGGGGGDDSNLGGGAGGGDAVGGGEGGGGAGDDAGVDAGPAVDAGSPSACLISSAPAVDFGIAVPGCGSVRRQVTLVNLCTVSVSLSSVAVTGSTQMTVAGVPTSVPAYASAVLTLSYAPTISGDAQGTLEIVTGEQDKPRLVVSLLGHADAAGRTVLTTTQQPSRLDLMLVIDDSGSMNDKQSRLADFNTQLINRLNAAQNWRVAVVAGGTDIAAPTSCRFFGQTRIVSNATPNWQQALTTNLTVGTLGIGISSFECAGLSLLPPLSTPEGYNRYFVRSDANLTVVAITDSDDQSGLSVDTVEGMLLSVKQGRRDRVTFSVASPSMVDPPTGCTYQRPDMNRLRALATRLRGSIDNVCAPTYSNVLQGISDQLAGLNTHFSLAGTPVSTPIVKVNGTVVPAMAWTIDPGDTGITFAPSWVPTIGDVVTIEYVQQCGP